MTKYAFFRHSRQREARIQRQLVDAIGERFARRVAQAIEAETLRIVRDYEATGNVPPADDAHEVALRILYEDLALVSVRTFGARILDQGKQIGALETKDLAGFAEFFQRLALAWIDQETIRERIVNVASYTRRRIVDAVLRGQESGESVRDIAARITAEAPYVSSLRANLIARTETHNAANYSMHETAKSTGLDLVKEWVATEDHRTRSIARDDAFDHIAMDGQTRDMDQPFDMPWLGGEPLKIMFPGEAGHPGGATINCRCSVAHRVKGF